MDASILSNERNSNGKNRSRDSQITTLSCSATSDIRGRKKSSAKDSVTSQANPDVRAGTGQYKNVTSTRNQSSSNCGSVNVSVSPVTSRPPNERGAASAPARRQAGDAYVSKVHSNDARPLAPSPQDGSEIATTDISDHGWSTTTFVFGDNDDFLPCTADVADSLPPRGLPRASTTRVASHFDGRATRLKSPNSTNKKRAFR